MDKSVEIVFFRIAFGVERIAFSLDARRNTPDEKKMIPVKIPQFIRWFFPSVLWKGRNNARDIYLTFDDGPTPRVTEEVIELLAQYNAKATFFCIGSRVESYPTIYNQILEQGHAVGNHTQNHLKGLKSSNKVYFNDVEKAATFIDSNLFRPPYGKMKWRQYLELKKRYKVVLWDIIPGDFVASNSAVDIIESIMKNVSNGSIIVLHDSDKCANKILKVLPVILDKLSKKGYQFKALTSNKL